MTKLMEICLNLLVVQKAGFLCSRLGEVGDHDNHRLLFLPLRVQAAWLKLHHAGVSILSIPRIEIQVEVANGFTSGGIVNSPLLNIFVPHLPSFYFGELQ